MIENKEEGIKIAENKEEAFWAQLKDKLVSDNDNMTRSIEINNHVLELVEKRLLK